MYDLSLVFSNYLSLIQHKKIWIAFSGGIDSHVLLHSFINFLNSTSINVEVNAIHVNHGLNKDSNIWQEHVSINYLLLSKCSTERVGIGQNYRFKLH